MPWYSGKHEEGAWPKPPEAERDEDAMDQEPEPQVLMETPFGGWGLTTLALPHPHHVQGFYSGHPPN